MKIYTKTGDKGQTGLYRGGRVSKSSIRVSVYGDVDELNSYIGLLSTFDIETKVSTTLKRIQNDLFIIGADLSTPEEAVSPKEKDSVMRISEGSELFLEAEIDRMETEMQPLTRFILPGGSHQASAAHIARTVCRRSERNAVKLSEVETISNELIIYLNRLSDYLFVLARYMNHRLNVSDVFWEK